MNKHTCRNHFPSDKEYNVIYADPPWPYHNTSPNHPKYPLMEHNELMDLPVKDIAHEHCALFLWTTHAMLNMALELIENWGFKYKTTFKIWFKVHDNGSPAYIPGFWANSNTELLLVATKGTPLKLFRKSKHTEHQTFTSTRGQHSEKPEEIREAIENFLTVDSRIELFARKNTPGWDSWGLDLPGYFFSCNDDIVYSDHQRSIGCQVNTIQKQAPKKNTVLTERIKSNNNIPLGHKPLCNCFVCKRVRETVSSQ